ncbi:MAG: low-specificity L-threonine aldolase [Pseudomonadales bacterium]|nr:low-specificity L-threonine aldolase [Pseudomonadales bacterium]
MTRSACIDLRSDTVTQPSAEMRQAMLEAPLGDDVYGEDPSINRLQDLLAERAGMAAALFMPSGTQSNLVALLTHCNRGDEYLVGQQAHTYKYEGGGAAALGGIQPQPLEFAADGTLDLDEIVAAIKPDDDHFARTRLLCLENTVHGKVLPLAYLERAGHTARAHGLALHLDGARIFNAAVALDVPLQSITRHVDTVSICLSKGLGAPVGSVLLGSADFIRRAHRWRKVTGGGLRQAGMLAAAGIYALNHNVDRLQQDHKRASRLAEGLRALGLSVEPAQTNMVFVDIPYQPRQALAEALAARNIRVDRTYRKQMRLVTHLDITDKDIDTVLTAFASVLQS